ncbi:hypothetical protein P9112_005527 [Eukaryota sp. TZLM1-RC]
MTTATHAPIDDYTTLHISAIRKLYTSIASHNDGIVSTSFILSLLENCGILEDDPRLEDLFPSTSSILSFEEFSLLLSKSYLIQRALEGNLIVSEWSIFADTIYNIYTKISSIEGGQVAQYIPQLKRVDPELFAVTVTTVDGQQLHLGDSFVPFSVQSCSKPITYCMALEEHGEEEVHQHVSRNPSGRGFNELVLDSKNRPHNPMINAGAIVCASLIEPSKPLYERFRTALDTWSALAADSRIGFDNATFLSELATADRNTVLAYLMKEQQGIFPPNVDINDVLSLYFMFCSIQTTCSQMGLVAATLANSGVCPLTRKRVFQQDTVRNCLSLMFSSGLYDFSGSFAYHVALPAKSSVSGVIMLVIPGIAGVCIWSPPLDSIGNSVKGVAFALELSKSLHQCSFASRNSVSVLDPKKYDLAVDSLEDSQIMLLFASAIGDINRITKLIARGCNVNFRDYDGRTALHLAVSTNQKEVVEYLVNHGADLTIKDRHGNSPVQDCVNLGLRELSHIMGVSKPETEPTTTFMGSPVVQKLPDTILAELEFEGEEETLHTGTAFIEVDETESHRTTPPINGSDIESESVVSEERPPDNHIVSIPYSLDYCNKGVVAKKDLIEALEYEGILPRFDQRLSSLFKTFSSEISYDQIEEACTDTPILQRALQGNLVIPDFSFTMMNFNSMFEKVRDMDIASAQNASYIPDLKNQDSSLFGISICTVHGQRAFFGDYKHPFTLQHCVNPFTYCLASEQLGETAYHKKVGLESSGLPSDHLSLDHDDKPHNPFINTGSLFSASVIEKGKSLADRYDFVRKVCFRSIGCPRGRLKVDHIGYSLTTYLSEMSSSDRNNALLYLMREKGVFEPDEDLNEVLRFYSMLCSIEFNTASLSIFAAVLANSGVCPFSGEQVFKSSTVRNCLALMTSTSMYDYSGEFQFSIGLPGCAGASGAVMVIVPNSFGIALFSPPLNASKVSAKSIEFCKLLQEKYLLHTLELSALSTKKNLLLWKDTRIYKNSAMLLTAASNGDISELRNLLRHLDVNLADYDARTALHVSVDSQQYEIVKLLLENGADTSLCDRWGDTPIQLALRLGDEKMISLLG